MKELSRNLSSTPRPTGNDNRTSWLNRTVLGIGLASLSSVVVGALWTWAGTAAAFGYCAALFVAGAALVLRVGKE